MVSDSKKGENSKEDAAKTTNTVPLKTVRGGDSVDKVSTLSCGTRHSMETETMKLLKTSKDTIEGQVRAYVKKEWYGGLKFMTTNTLSNKIIVQGIDACVISVPKNIPIKKFCAYFDNAVPKALAKLRHNNQTLARKNWFGK